MGDSSVISILKRKAAEGLTDHLARAMTPGKAMRLSMALAAEKGMGLALEVTAVAHRKLRHEELIGALDSESLLAILEGENGEPGAFALDMQILSGLVEHQTLGRVIPKPVFDRLPSRVDAALVTPFLEDALAKFVEYLGKSDAPKWLQHYKFGAMTAGKRTLGLTLKAFDFHLFVLDISLDGGAKVGTLAMAFPDIQPAVESKDPENGAAVVSEEFQKTILQAPATLNAILGRIKLPIGHLQALQVGEMLTLPRDVLKDTILETDSGEEVATVSFGQANGMRAVRLSGESLKAVLGKEVMTDVADDAAFVAEGVPPAAISSDPAPLPMMEPMAELEIEPMMDLPDFDLPQLDIGVDSEGESSFGGLDDLDTFDDLDGLDDLDELIQLGTDDIGDPGALADLPMTGTG